MNKVWEQEKDWYVTRCACNNNDHTIDVVYDNGGIELDFKCFCRTANFWDRIKTAWNILISGKIETFGEFFFENKKHVEDFITALDKLNKR